MMINDKDYLLFNQQLMYNLIFDVHATTHDYRCQELIIERKQLEYVKAHRFIKKNK